MSSIPAAQTVQFYSRDGTTVAVAPQQKPSSSSVSSGAVTAVTEVPVTTATTGTTASFQLNADTLQLIGMSATLPNSNLFVNYPHTKWERDAEGNMIPIQVQFISSLFRLPLYPIPTKLPTLIIKLDQFIPLILEKLVDVCMFLVGIVNNPMLQFQVATNVVSDATVSAKTEGDALSQATAVIKNEIPNNSLKSGNNVTKSFICSICNKGFAKREHLTKHTRIHKEAKR